MNFDDEKKRYKLTKYHVTLISETINKKQLMEMLGILSKSINLTDLDASLIDSLLAPFSKVDDDTVS